MTETVFKEKHGEREPMPEWVDYNHSLCRFQSQLKLNHGPWETPMPESTWTLFQGDFIPQPGPKNFASGLYWACVKSSGARMPRFAGCCPVGTRRVAMTTCTATTWPSASWRSSVSGLFCKIMCALGWRKVRRPFAETCEGEMLIKIINCSKTMQIFHIFLFDFFNIMIFLYS